MSSVLLVGLELEDSCIPHVASDVNLRTYAPTPLRLLLPVSGSPPTPYPAPVSQSPVPHSPPGLPILSNSSKAPEPSHFNNKPHVLNQAVFAIFLSFFCALNRSYSPKISLFSHTYKKKEKLTKSFLVGLFLFFPPSPPSPLLPCPCPCPPSSSAISDPPRFANSPSQAATSK